MKWNYRSADLEQVGQLAGQLRFEREISETIAHLLVLRGITDFESAERFLNPSLSHLHSPYLMLGMKAAVDRIDAAIERKESVLIYGDYDVDGTTAIVILKTAIELCGGATDFHVPHRIKEGYDLRGDVIERAATAGVHLIISVDAGIRAFAAAETARQQGVDLIVTDHHLPGPEGVPHALAVLNPNQPGCEYPCKALCGAGVAFKLAQALMERRLAHRDQPALLKSFAKMVAIATIADCVPLTGENRIFSKLGLDGLRTAVNPGLKALLEAAQVSGRAVTSTEVGFRVAPRINAAGRMDIAADVIELFSTKDTNRARELAAKLDKLNADRQDEERRILDAITARFDEDPTLPESFCIVVDGEGWHRGVIGITASRVVEKYHRPTIVISRQGDEAHGSGRSIRAFHMLNALESCAHLFTRFGGHSHAVGFSLPAERVNELRVHLDSYARGCMTLADFEPTLQIDAELELANVTPKLFEVLSRLEPFGTGNYEPVFAARNVRITAPPQIMKEKHVRFRLAWNGESSNQQASLLGPRCHPDAAAIPKRSDNWRKAVVHKAIGWRLAEQAQQAQLIAGDAIDVAFTLDQNDHPDFGGIELSLRDFTVTGRAGGNAGAPSAVDEAVTASITP